MELHQVRYFVALARSMNFTRAAEQCNVTQPALTKAIQKLEYELGGPLVFRERQLTQLTDLGKLMLPMLDRSLSAVEAARSNAKEFKRKKVATLRVALTPSISASILMKPLAEVTRQVSGLQVDLVEVNSSNVFDGLLSGEIGVALGDLYFQGEDLVVGQEGAEHGVRLEVRLLAQGAANGSIYAAKPRSHRAASPSRRPAQ